MIVVKYFFAISLGLAVGRFLSVLCAKKIEEKNNRLILNIASYGCSVLLFVLFATFSSANILADKFLTKQIVLVEGKIEEIFPGLINKESKTDEITKLHSELSDVIDEITRDETYGFFANLILKEFSAHIPGSVQNAGGTTLNFLQENETLSVDSVLQFAKSQAEDVVMPLWTLGKVLTVAVFIVFLIAYLCLYAYFKKGGALYNKSITFGDEKDFTL